LHAVSERAGAQTGLTRCDKPIQYHIARMAYDPRQITDPVFFSRLDNLELRARGIVEGFMHGLHRSPFVGFSVEFASHREYAQGDDLRHVNWKLFARSRRLYVKQFDAETN